jgi:hypothetical protein
MNRGRAVLLVLAALLVAHRVEAETSKPKITGAPGKGVTFGVDDAFSMTLRARAQLRYSWNELDEPPKGRSKNESLVNIQTLRIYLMGHAYTPKLLYTIQLAVAGRDYRDGATSPIFDAFLDYKLHRDFNVKAGQFFVPFDRLRTVREFALQLADRPIPVSELTLDRDTGVALYSDRFLGTPLAWRVGAFGGGGTNQLNGKDFGGLVVGRLEVRPLGALDDESEGDLERRTSPRLAFGVAAAQNWNTNRVRSTTGATFSGGTTDYRHTAADLVFKWRGFAVQAEYLRKLADVDTIQSTSDGKPVTEYTRSGHGWILQASYVFRRPLEVVGRLSRLDTLARTDPKLIAEVDKRSNEVAAGLNYYFNGHALKLQADWIARTSAQLDLGAADHVVHVLLDATL